MKTIELILKNYDNYYMRETFNTLRTNVFFSGRNIKSIIITSVFASEGKTFVSVGLASSIAASGKRVLLLDADVRGSLMVTNYTKERGVTGLSQLLSGQASADTTIYKTQNPNLDVIFSGSYPPNPAELLGSDACRELLDSVREEYDYIIIDSAPAGIVTDAAVLGSFCDASIVVINSGLVKRRQAHAVLQRIEKSGCKMLGVVLNHATLKKRKKRKSQKASV